MYLHLGPCGYFFLYLPSHLLGTYTLLQRTLSLEFSQSIYLLCGRSPPDGCSASAACLLYLRIISLPLGLWKTIVLYLFSVLLMAAEASILFPPQWFLSHARTWSSQSWYRLWSPLPLPEPILVPGWENHNTPEYARCRHTGFIQGKKKDVPCFVLYSHLRDFWHLICLCDSSTGALSRHFPKNLNSKERSFPWMTVAVRGAIILYIKFSCVNHLIFNTFLTLNFVPNTPALCYE